MFLTYKWDIGPHLCTVKCVLDIQMCFGHTNEKMLLLALFTPHSQEPGFSWIPEHWMMREHPVGRMPPRHYELTYLHYCSLAYYLFDRQIHTIPLNKFHFIGLLEKYRGVIVSNLAAARQSRVNN